MSSRRRTLAVVAAAVLGGLCFAPVFGLTALLLPVLAVGAAVYAVTELCRLRAGIAAWRPLLVAVAGLLAVVETVLRATTAFGAPTVDSLRALGRGLTAWRSTLESTWPARPEPDLVVFVPLLVLLACLLAVELLDRAPPLVAVLPGLVVAGVGQLYIALSGAAAVLVAFGYGLVLAAVLAPDRQPQRRATRSLAPVVAAAILAMAAVAGSAVLTAFDPAQRTPYTLQQVQSTAAPTMRQTSPLDELASRLSPGKAGTVVFRYQSAAPVSRWRQVALDEFDGSNWTTGHPLLRLGSDLEPGPDVRVEVTKQKAVIEPKNLSGPWLPSQVLPSSVRGVVDPQVEPVGGTLLTREMPERYELTWSKPSVDANLLVHAGVDPQLQLGELGAMPNEVAALASEALADKRATFATALALESFLRKRYPLATTEPLPTGHGWPQLQRFLLDGEPGTSEQFAAAYVVLARANGIPARLVVGFRGPARPDADGWYTVRNGDAFAWPEVAVDGVGWWPLDPAGQATAGKAAADGTEADVTDQARAAVPPVNEIEDPEVAPPAAGESGRSWDGFDVPVLGIFLVSAGVLVLWLVGVPLLKFLRAVRRRRRPGDAAVVGAWAEVRDRLRAHGVDVTRGMTVRDLAAAAADVTDTRTNAGLATVASSVDRALWSGGAAGPEIAKQAWDGVREVRRGLRSRPWLDRLQAALELRSLF